MKRYYVCARLEYFNGDVRHGDFIHESVSNYPDLADIKKHLFSEDGCKNVFILNCFEISKKGDFPKLTKTVEKKD